jgi:hypothetical protein
VIPFVIPFYGHRLWDSYLKITLPPPLSNNQLQKRVKGSIVVIVDVDARLKRWWTTETAPRPYLRHLVIQAFVNQMTAGLRSLGHRRGVHQRLSGYPG